MKQGMFALLVAAAVFVCFSLSQRVAHLTDCRNYARNGGLISDYYFLKAACPNPGPYGERSSVFLYALFSPLANLSGPPTNTNASGKWQVATNGGPVPVCQLTQSGSEVGGICDGPAGIGPVKGSVNGQTISWSWDWSLKGNSSIGGRWTFDGHKNSGGDIVGSAQGMNGRSVNFMARPVTD